MCSYFLMTKFSFISNFIWNASFLKFCIYWKIYFQAISEGIGFCGADVAIDHMILRYMGKWYVIITVLQKFYSSFAKAA